MPAGLAEVRGLRRFNGLHLSAVYFLICRGEVVYVGQSTNLASRIGGHGDKEFDQVVFLPVGRSRLDAVENEWIEKLRPRYNRTAWGAPLRNKPCYTAEKILLTPAQAAAKSGIDLCYILDRCRRGFLGQEMSPYSWLILPEELKKLTKPHPVVVDQCRRRWLKEAKTAATFGLEIA